jgi:hypothetical protein
VRWYSQDQAAALFEAAGFVDLHMTAGDSETPATPDDNSIKIRGTRP